MIIYYTQYFFVLRLYVVISLYIILITETKSNRTVTKGRTFVN